MEETVKSKATAVPVDKVWCNFIAWFLDYRLGPVLHARAGLVRSNYTFKPIPAMDGGKDRNIHYNSVKPDQIEADSYIT